MASFATVTLPDGATKVRFKEPFTSEALNRKSAGIVPPGIYRGFIPAPAAGFILNLNVDPSKNDSVAVVETPQAYNLSVRSSSQISLDMTGQVIFPVFVVLRTEYQISPSPLLGLTTSKVMVVETTLDNSDPLKLHDGDVKLCKVLGFIGTVPNVSAAVPSDRQDNGGPAVVPAQLFGNIITVQRTSGSFSPPDSGGAWVDMPGPGASPTFDIVFTPNFTGKAEVVVSGSMEGVGVKMGFGLQVNGVDLIPAGSDPAFGSPLPNGFSVAGGGRGGGTPAAVSGNFGFTTFIDVVAGVLTTVRLRYSVRDMAGAVSRTIFATPGHPIIMTVKYR